MNLRRMEFKMMLMLFIKRKKIAIKLRFVYTIKLRLSEIPFIQTGRSVSQNLYQDFTTFRRAVKRFRSVQISI